MAKKTYMIISLFTDGDEIVVVPKGTSAKYFDADMDLDIFILISMNSERELFYKAITRAFDLWNTQKPHDEQKLSSMARFAGLKREVQVIENFKYIYIGWDIENGYNIIPSIRQGKMGYELVKSKQISIGHEISVDTIKDDVLKAIEMSQ